jgi:hypothetical protein
MIKYVQHNRRTNCFTILLMGASGLRGCGPKFFLEQGSGATCKWFGKGEQHTFLDRVMGEAGSRDVNRVIEYLVANGHQCDEHHFPA